MNSILEKFVLEATGAQVIQRTELIQKLWNNYGELIRIYLDGGVNKSVILKHIKLPSSEYHPKGFNSELSKQRKIKSYQVEGNWYEFHNHVNLQDDNSPTAKLLAGHHQNGETFILLEDLDDLGFDLRVRDANFEQIKSVLSWLASFHAKFMHHDSTGLWESGTYWHLETRPDELAALNDLQLKFLSPLIDQKLKNTNYLTIVHGDAKLANFCFSTNSNKVAAVDFQYVGSGCGMKDVAYFVGSCLGEDECEERETEILNFYFGELSKRVHDTQIDFKELEHQWRSLYRTAWADFHRFLKGWSPDHWKINSYSEKVTREEVNSIIDELLEVGQNAALKAGQLISDYWQKDFKVSSKAGNSLSSSVVTEVDLLSQNIITSMLKPSIEKYDLGLLAEEDDDDQTRLTKNLFWSVDPLDGTLLFSEGKSGYAVSIALVSNSGQSVIGIVYDPVKKTLYHAIKDGGSYQDSNPLDLSEVIEPDSIHLFADRSFKNSSQYDELKQKFVIHFEGGAVMNAINTLLQQNSCYIKYPKREVGGCAIWDLAAVSLILNESGGVVTNFQGSELNLNNPKTIYFNQEGIIICSNQAVFQKIKALI